MKHIGLIGGLSPESTAEYLRVFGHELEARGLITQSQKAELELRVDEYLSLCRDYNTKHGGCNSRVHRAAFANKTR